jgi:hypothetical protein
MIERLVEGYETKVLSMSGDEYHSDKSAVSSSTLKNILKSPRSFLTAYEEPKEEDTLSMTLGTALHCLVLEPKVFVKTYIQMPDFGDFRTKAAKEERDDWLDTIPSEITPISKKMWDTVFAMGNAIQNHKDAKLLIRNGIAEKSIFYRDPGTGLRCKVRPDYYNESLGVLIDVKTTIDCTQDSFSKTIWNYRYDFQMAMYMEGLKLLTGKDFDYGVFIAVEKEPPYEVGVYKVDADLVMKGRIDYRRALDLLSECIHKNEWPSYQQGMKEISLPKWALSKEL